MDADLTTSRDNREPYRAICGASELWELPESPQLTHTSGAPHRRGERLRVKKETLFLMVGKSMFGSQDLSNRRTAPAHGFGSSTRHHSSKIFIGPEHAKISSASCTPGPCYEVAGACGNQHDSGKMSPPQWCFGTADRFAGSPRKRTPGPGAYENAGAFGKQGLSNRSSFPLYGFGTVDRSMASKVLLTC